jgi:hypothetical protein
MGRFNGAEALVIKRCGHHRSLLRMFSARGTFGRRRLNEGTVTVILCYRHRSVGLRDLATDIITPPRSFWR